RSLVLLTRQGFPEGRIFGTTDFNRLGVLADLYSRLVTSDAVTARLEKTGPIDGDVSAGSIISSTRQPTPMLAIYGTSPTPSKSVALTERATDAFLGYLKDRQQRADSRPNDRVQASIVDRIGSLALVQPRKKTLPIVVFLAVMSAAIALIYALEGAR